MSLIFNQFTKLLNFLKFKNLVNQSLSFILLTFENFRIVSDTDFDHVRLEAQQFRPLERCKKDIMSHRVIVSPDCVFLVMEMLNILTARRS